MSAPPQPAAAGGFAPPPFVSRGRAPGAARRWWSGLTGRGRTALSISACIALALVAVLVVSAGTGNGAPRTTPEPRETRGAVSRVSDSIVRELESVGLTVLSWRLRTLLDRMASVAPEVERKLSELSQVVQGGLCGGMVARLQQVPDVLMLESEDEVPGDPEGSWRYANRLADEYLPVFEQCRRELASLRPRLVSLGPVPLRAPLEMLLGSCDLQLDAAGSFVRALRLVRDCDPMTVGQALELAQSASSGIAEGSASLEGAVDSIALVR